MHSPRSAVPTWRGGHEGLTRSELSHLARSHLRRAFSHLLLASRHLPRRCPWELVAFHRTWSRVTRSGDFDFRRWQSTFHRWRNRCGGMKANDVKQQAEYARLRSSSPTPSSTSRCSRCWLRNTFAPELPTGSGRAAHSSVRGLRTALCAETNRGHDHREWPPTPSGSSSSRPENALLKKLLAPAELDTSRCAAITSSWAQTGSLRSPRRLRSRARGFGRHQGRRRASEAHRALLYKDPS